MAKFTNAPFLIKTTDGLPVLASEVAWDKYGVAEPKEFAYVVWDGKGPTPDTVAGSPALFGEYEVCLKDGSIVEVKTALQILREWIDTNLAALTKKYGVATTWRLSPKKLISM